ncbi:hypothetical protein NPX13_g3556 [Xylaria arbuscula]|uniref:Heterokaryon incompatibility domain-containing protein n=1 Tax=Xylaria arbuscula TaxID=114810 RepID=A0A9W8TN45_9PEZI|nr:hypothetical protein NPX13_g3556 [Xylaria arbuscula]
MLVRAVFRELIANAADASAKTVKIRIITSPRTNPRVDHRLQRSLNYVIHHNVIQRIVVHNDGRPFQEEDWNRLTSIAEGNPGDQSIGMFGLGFYSVFKLSDEPVVCSKTEALIFKWEGKTLYSSRIPLPPEKHIDDTRVELEYSNADVDVPDLIEIGQFLATSLMSVDLLQIELWLDEWMVLSLGKSVRNKSIASTADFKMNTEHMEIQNVETGIMQIDGYWLNSLYRDITTPLLAQVTASHVRGYLIDKSSETPRTALEARLAAQSFSTTESHSRTLTREQQPLEQSTIREQNLNSDEQPSVQCASVCMRITTATVSTKFHGELALGIEAVIKKKPTHRTYVSILTSCGEQPDPCPFFEFIIPSRKHHGKILVGFSTLQTSGLQAHIMMQSILTLERELIDLTTDHVRVWNKELLQVAGIIGRIVWAEEMNITKNYRSNSIGPTLKKEGWTPGRKGLTLVNRNEQLSNARRLFRQFDFQASAPHSEVISIIEEYFWKACEYIDIISTQGVYRSTEVRLENTHVAEFANCYPILPGEFIDKYKNFVRKLKSAGFISEVTNKDIETELSSKTINERQLEKLFIWASKNYTNSKASPESKESIVSTMKAATVKISQSSKITLGKVEYFAAYKLPNELLPPHVIPFTYSQIYGMSDWFQGIGWKPLPVLEWLRRCERKVKEFMNNPAGAENVLAVISSNLKPEDYAKAVGNLPLVPTDNGMRVPAEAYFRSAVSFEGLPYVKDMTNVSEKFLETLGVRRTVKMNTIVQHLGSVADQPDMFQKYLSYLIAIPQPLPDTDLQKLSTASIWYAERRDQKKGHTRARYMLTELCEPSDELRGLKIPTLYLPQGYRQEGLEGRFLRSAGLRRHPSVSELIKILDEDDQLERLELCVSYLIRKFALPSEEDKKTLSSARIWHAEDSRGLKGCRSEKKYVLSELFEPLDQLRGLELQVLYLPQGYRPRGPEGDFFRTLGIRRRLSIPDLIRIMGETEKPHLLEVCIAYLIDSLRSFSHADREALYNAPIWYAEAENGKGFESHKKYTLDKLFEPSDSMRELKVPTLYLPQGYRHDGLEGQFFRPFGLKSYPSAPELISIITTAISQGDYALRDHGLSYFIKHFEVNGYRAYDLNSSTAQFLPLEGSQEDHARPGECFTNGKAAVLGFPILRKDLHGMAIKFTVKFDPPLSVCIDRLVENPPQTRDTAEEVYTYLITSFREELPCHHKRLRTSAIVPIFPRQEADRTPSNTVHNKTTLLRPPECFIGNLDGEIMEIADLFRCEYYGGKAAEFLTLCGAPKTPTGDHIAEKFLADPQRVLEVLRSPEAYDRWFASLGKRYRSGDICVKLRNDMRKARFLLTITYDTQENTATRCWSTAEEAIVVDDINLFNHFRPHLNAVVQDDGVESFSELLNSKKLSSIVRQRYEITSPASGPKADHWRSRILTRSKIFLHDIGLSRTKVSWEELESHLQVRVAESIDRYFVLGDVICHDKTNATATKNSEDYVVTIVPDDDLPYSLGGELAKLFVKKPKVADALLFESIFQKTLDALQRRGYNTDRILGLNQQIVSQSPLQLRVEEQRVTITETQEVGNAERGRKKTQGTVSASSYQYVERLTVEHETNRSHSRGLGRTLHREETKSPYRPWVLPRNRQESSQNSNEFINMDVGVIINPFPITIFADEDDEDTRYFGELYMSRFLTSFLGPEFYKPNKHWTSHLRSRNGHTRYRKNPSSSTFTIRERHGKLGHFILQWRDDISFYKSCKFHIEVSATNGDLHSQFILSNPQFVKAQELTLDDITEVKEVYILARVYKVCENPGIALYLDPWRLHRDGLISLQSQSSYEGRISKAAPAMLVVDSANHSFSGRPHKFYEGLDVGPGEIRLLKLTLDEDSVPLRGSLIITSVDSSDPFWAISYFWGPKPTPLSPFYFHTSLGKIPITESLATCLQYLRHRRVSVYLWADAVCINQRNSIEKNMQVRSMGSLYSKAERVIVWMGDKREEDYHALDLLNKLQGPSEGPPAWDTSANDDLWNGINNFLQRPWFTRTWIIQELVLGRKVSVMCGNSEIGWDELIRGITECQNRLNRTGLGGGDKLFLPNSWRALNLDCIRKHFNNHLKFSFLELLEMFYYTRTSDPRDKLFALLNMAYDTGIGREAFFPDYDSTEEVILANYAKQFVELGSVLDLLYRAGTDKGSNFCTWIPDLMNQQRKAQYPPTISTWEAAGSGTQPGFRAARFLPKAQVQRDIAVKNHVIPILSIMGILFDSIWSCHPLELGSGNTGIQFSNTLRDLRQKIWDLNSYPNASKNWKEELLIKCLIGDAIRPHTKPCWPFSDQSQQAQPLRWPEGFEQELLGLRPDQDAHEYAAKSPESLAVIDQFWQTAANFTDRIPHATVCITKEGYMGIVPGSTLPGDKIFIADGAKVPFVLKKDTDTAFHKLIGECYIHGLMYHSDYTTKDLKHEEVFIV